MNAPDAHGRWCWLERWEQPKYDPCRRMPKDANCKACHGGFLVGWAAGEGREPNDADREAQLESCRPERERVGETWDMGFRVGFIRSQGRRPVVS